MWALELENSMPWTKEWSRNPASFSKEMLAGLRLRMETEKNAPEKILWCFSVNVRKSG